MENKKKSRGEILLYQPLFFIMRLLSSFEIPYDLNIQLNYIICAAMYILTTHFPSRKKQTSASVASVNLLVDHQPFRLYNPPMMNQISLSSIFCSSTAILASESSS